MVEQMRRYDPLRCAVELPFAGRYFPAGFELDIASNSPDVLSAAEEAWGSYLPEFACEPLRLRILVQPEGGLAPEPAHRLQEHLYAIVSDSHNFAQIDLQALRGFLYISQQTAADHSWFRWFFLEASTYIMLAQRYVVPVHAACVATNGSGILLAGPTGAGKSSLSYACARAGWTFVTDDCTWLLADTDCRVAIGRPRQARFRLDAPRLFPELAGYAVRARPNGKIGIEVSLVELPQIRTCIRAPISGVVFLERGPGGVSADPVSAAESLQRLLAETATYGERTDALHERTLRRLAEAPAWRLRYEALEDGIRILETLAI